MNYFKKKFLIDKSGKSHAYFLKKNVYIKFNNIFFKKLKIHALSEKKNIRICCHQNKKDKLHNMFNLILKKNGSFKYHKHNLKDEIYQIIYGSVEIEILYKNKKKKIILDDNNKVLRISKNTFHKVKSKSDVAIFHEIRLGPFSKSDSIFKK